MLCLPDDKPFLRDFDLRRWLDAMLGMIPGVRTWDLHVDRSLASFVADAFIRRVPHHLLALVDLLLEILDLPYLDLRLHPQFLAPKILLRNRRLLIKAAPMRHHRREVY